MLQLREFSFVLRLETKQILLAVVVLVLLIFECGLLREVLDVTHRGRVVSLDPESLNIAAISLEVRNGDIGVHLLLADILNHGVYVAFALKCKTVVISVALAIQLHR